LENVFGLYTLLNLAICCNTREFIERTRVQRCFFQDVREAIVINGGFMDEKMVVYDAQIINGVTKDLIKILQLRSRL